MNTAWQIRTLSFFQKPSRSLETALWVFLIATIVAIRVYLWHLIPFYLWSKDATSYAFSSWHWLDTGVWENDPRRGPIYSVFIAACLQLFGSFSSVVIIQHILAGASILGALIVFRKMQGPRVWLPLAACGWAYAVYAGPLSMEQIIRNETLIFTFATATLAGFWLGLHRSPHWFWLAGISASLLALTKSVFVPFPIMAFLGIVWLHRSNWSLAVKPVLILAAALALPLLGAKIFHQLTVHDKPSEPQAGLLLFGRVAQFTVLDGGIEPEIKTLIRPDIQSYRTLIVEEDDLDNNIPLNRTAVPHMRAWLLARGKTPGDLNNLCRRLAVEAIQAHRQEYFSQAWNDFSRLHLTFGKQVRGPSPADVLGTKKNLAPLPDPHPSLDRDELFQKIDALPIQSKGAAREYFSTWRKWVDKAWLFQFSPVLLTSLLLPFFILFTKQATRWWWLTCAALWYFNAILLSTVGKPMDRYLLPVVPIMFWTLSSAVAAVWFALLQQLERITLSKIK